MASKRGSSATLALWLLIAVIAMILPATAQNLLVNPGCEESLVGGHIPGWTDSLNTGWTRAAWITPHGGAYHFWAGTNPYGKLMQDVDVSLYAPSIDLGAQRFLFELWQQSWNQSPADSGRYGLVCFAADHAQILSEYSTSNIANLNQWVRLSYTLRPPAGTRWIRVRLESTRCNGNDNDSYFDDLSLQAPPPDTLSAPQTVVALEGIGRITLYWNRAPGQGTLYHVYKDSLIHGAFSGLLGITADTMFVDSSSSVLSHTKSYYIVRSATP